MYKNIVICSYFIFLTMQTIKIIFAHILQQKSGPK